MGLVRRKMMLRKDVTMVMFSSSPPPLCRSVAVCIATLKMGGQEGCFLITVRLILQLLLAWELHKSQACESLEVTIDWVTCARQRLYLSMRWHCPEDPVLWFVTVPETKLTWPESQWYKNLLVSQNSGRSLFLKPHEGLHRSVSYRSRIPHMFLWA